jgi:hypothetical protein
VTSDKLQVASIEVFDIFGRTVLSHTANHTPHTVLDISHLPAGIYIVKVDDVYQKIIKQ